MAFMFAWLFPKAPAPPPPPRPAEKLSPEILLRMDQTVGQIEAVIDQLRSLDDDEKHSAKLYARSKIRGGVKQLVDENL